MKIRNDRRTLDTRMRFTRFRSRLTNEESADADLGPQLVELLTVRKPLRWSDVNALLHRGADVNYNSCAPLEALVKRIWSLLHTAGVKVRYRSDVLDEAEDLYRIMVRMLDEGAGLPRSVKQKVQDIAEFYDTDTELLDAAFLRGELEVS